MSLAFRGFESYVYGRKVFIQIFHNPLEAIMKKSLLSAPKRLRLQKFDLEVAYRKGTEMHIADPLSRAYLPSTNQDEKVKKDV